MSIILFFFFFSSRRRHTIFSRDWSSDVCSSDLDEVGPAAEDPVAAGVKEDDRHIGPSGELLEEAGGGGPHPGQPGVALLRAVKDQAAQRSLDLHPNLVGHVGSSSGTIRMEAHVFWSWFTRMVAPSRTSKARIRASERTAAPSSVVTGGGTSRSSWRRS